MHHSKLTMLRFLLGVAVALLLCFGLQAVCYYGLGWKTGKGDSNYFSTMGRFQAAAQAPAEIAFAGSSISGRIPGREIGNDNIANLGCDGSGALDGIAVMANGLVPSPRWLVVETNTLFAANNPSESLVVRGCGRPGFVLGSEFPLLGASARPAAMIYSFLSRRGNVMRADAYPVDVTPIAVLDFDSPSEHERLLMENYSKHLEMIADRGVKILLAHVPAGIRQERDQKLELWGASVLCRNHGYPFVDLEKQIGRDRLTFTDGVHLDPQSAASILTTISELCRRLDSDM
jgi:hypothetical protein